MTAPTKTIHAATTPASQTTMEVVEVTGGVDTHKDSHTAAALDAAGRVLGSAQFDADGPGYRALLAWLGSFGQLLLVGVEGTGVYGAGLARFLTEQGVAMVEVDRPSRKTRRFQGKSDPLDAEAAARTALAQVRVGVPKQRDSQVESLRTLRTARRSAVAGRADAQRQIKSLIITAPEPLRAQLRGLGDKALIDTCAGLRPDRDHVEDPTVATKVALRILARRHQGFTAEINDLDPLLTGLVTAVNPGLLELHGVGTDAAGQLLVTAGQNTDRLTSEAAFAMLCGVAPIPASSGKSTRHRLNRGGDRQANATLYRIVICRLRWHEPTRAYAARRTAEGLSKPEIIRCLKRYLAREIFTALQPQPAAATLPTAA